MVQQILKTNGLRHILAQTVSSVFFMVPVDKALTQVLEQLREEAHDRAMQLTYLI
jgi:hypothetical protein